MERRRTEGNSLTWNHIYNSGVTRLVFQRNTNEWDCLHWRPMKTEVLSVHFRAGTSTDQQLLQIATVITGEWLLNIQRKYSYYNIGETSLKDSYGFWCPFLVAVTGGSPDPPYFPSWFVPTSASARPRSRLLSWWGNYWKMVLTNNYQFLRLLPKKTTSDFKQNNYSHVPVFKICEKLQALSQSVDNITT